MPIQIAKLFNLFAIRRYNFCYRYNGHLREVNTATFVLWSIPNKICTFFITWIGVCDGSAFRNRFRILTVLKTTDPFICFGVSCLDEKSTEIFTTSNSHCRVVKHCVLNYHRKLHGSEMKYLESVGLAGIDQWWQSPRFKIDRKWYLIEYDGWRELKELHTSYGRFSKRCVLAAPWFGWLNRSGLTPI